MGSTQRPGGLTSALATRAKGRQQVAEKLSRRIAEHIARHAPDLAAGASGVGLDSTALQRLLADVGKEADLAGARIVRQLLYEQLKSLQKKTGGNVALPSPAIVLHRKPSPFRPQVLQTVPWLSRLTVAFFLDIQKEPSVPVDVAAGRIVFSAITSGGLLDRGLIAAFPLAVQNGLAAHVDCCWLEIVVHKEKTDEKTIRRWFPDPVTQCLLASWYEEKREWPWVISISTLIDRLLSRLGGKNELHKGNHLGTLLTAAEALFRLQLPSVLVDFLRSDHCGQSLGNRAWWRLCGDRNVYEKPDPAPSEDDLANEACRRLEPPEEPPTHFRRDSSEDLQAVQGLKRCFAKWGKRAPQAADTKRALQKFKSTLGPRGPMFTALMDWSAWLLEMLGTGDRRARPSSIHRYLVSLAEPLVSLAGSVDPQKTSTADLAATYETVVSSIVSDLERSKVVRCLRDFHAFLTLTREVDPVEIDGAMVNGRVRANVVCERDYERVLRVIDESFGGREDDRLRRMYRVILIVGYRLGPRKTSELAHLRITDVQAARKSSSLRPLLWIHAHPDHALKNDASIRRLPIALLLTAREKREFDEWVAFRTLECGPQMPKQALIFCETGQHTEALDDAHFNLVVELIRGICADDSIVFHALRHSFLMNLFVRLMLAELKHLFGRSVACPWMIEDQEGMALQKRLFKSDILPREAAYLLSALAGHLDPTETMRSYIHLQDWVAGLFVAELAANHSLSLWASLEGISTESLRVRHARSKHRLVPHIDTPRRMLGRLDLPLPDGKLCSSSLSAPYIRLEVLPRVRQLPVEAIFCALGLAKKSMTHAAREQLTQIDRKTYARLVDTAVVIACSPTVTRNKKGRRARWLAKIPKRTMPSLKRLPQLDGFAPAVPRPRIERNDARTVFRNACDPERRIDIVDVEFLLGKTSHSSPFLLMHQLDDVKRAATLLSQLGIARRRLRLELLSVPRLVENRKEWLREVATRTGFPISAVTVARGLESLPLSIKKFGHGRVALRVLETQDADHVSNDGGVALSLSYGWRVGCYYALCVRKTMEEIPAGASKCEATQDHLKILVFGP